MADGDAAVLDVTAAAAPRVKRERVVLDGNLIDEHNELVAMLDQAVAAHGTGAPEAEAAAERVVASEQRLADAEVEFVFKAMGRGNWRKLKADHPPTEAQVAANPMAPFDSDNFPFVAMARCLVTPSLSEAQLRELEESVLDEATYKRLWLACLHVNIGEQVNLPESVAARSVLRIVRLRSEQPSSLESAEAS